MSYIHTPRLCPLVWSQKLHSLVYLSIYIYICMYVCMYVYIYIYVCVYAYTSRVQGISQNYVRKLRGEFQAHTPENSGINVGFFF